MNSLQHRFSEAWHAHLVPVAAALLTAIPVFVALTIICALSGKRGLALPVGEQGFPLAAERSLVWLLAERKRIDYQRIPLVASAAAPGALPHVVVTCRSAGRMRVETHIGGGGGLPLFIAPGFETLRHSMAGGRLTNVETETSVPAVTDWTPERHFT